MAARKEPDEQAEWNASCHAVTFQEFWRMASSIYRDRQSERGRRKWIALAGSAICFTDEPPRARSSRRPLKAGA